MKKLFFIAIILILFLPMLVNAEDVLGDSVVFNIEPSYDSLKREEIQATLEKISNKAYWYIDSNWLDGMDSIQYQEATASLNSLSIEFDDRIYPILTQIFGNEWRPGIDNDLRITILIHPMDESTGGYFNSADEFSKSQIPTSNEREMIYFNAVHLSKVLAKSFLAHEFQHLISFNQKEKTYGVNEDIWLNEARSEYISTLLGYNQEFQGSNLERKLKSFLDKPYDSLTEWRNLPYDYGVVNLFIHYLVDHYGLGIITNSLKSPYTGIKSINYALSRVNFEKDFSEIFTDWTITVLVNDCSISPTYCYLDENLKTLKLMPSINYLPVLGNSVLSVTNTTKDWSGNWHKFIGGNHSNLKLEFITSPSIVFKIPYLIQDNEGKLSIAFLELDTEGNGVINVSNFGSENISLIIIPSAQNKISNFSESEQSISFFWSASTAENEENKESELIKSLLDQIASLQAEIARLQSQIAAALGSGSVSNNSCVSFEKNLYYGLTDNSEVKCLQEFLKSQGAEVYPEGLVTGNFLTLTKQAVIRFQEKYVSEILHPLGLEKGTGFVGSMTRIKINQLYH